MPYDFEETRDGTLLRSLMIQIADQNGMTLMPPLLAVTKECLDGIQDNPATLPLDLTKFDTSAIDVTELDRLLRSYARLSSYLSLLQSIYSQTVNMQGRPLVAYTVPFTQSDNVESLKMIGTIIRYILLITLILVIVIGVVNNFSDSCQRDIETLFRLTSLMITAADAPTRMIFQTSSS